MKIETSYVNMKHPEFIGGEQAVKQVHFDQLWWALNPVQIFVATEGDQGDKDKKKKEKKQPKEDSGLAPSAF